MTHEKNPDTFCFKAYRYNTDLGELVLDYSAGNYAFTEKITFPGSRRKLTANEKAVLDKVFRTLHLAAGVSYYKAFLSPKIKVETQPLSTAEAVFFNDFYVNGLGEFSYRNNININLNFKGEIPYETPREITLPKGVLVPVGGGKDSVVTLEALRKKGIKPTMFAVGKHKAINNVFKVAGFPFIEVKRELSPNLLKLNQENGGLNGHVPITGILSFIMLATAIIYGFDTVVMSNERSANVGNTKRQGKEINHQWSKSLAFENMFANFVKHNLVPSFNYFSLLRPFSELEIAKRFAKYPQYFDVFTSCNHAFKIDEKNRSQTWCGNCDKCRFVFLALAPFVTRAEMTKIFGKDLLADPEQEQGYKELLGISAFKPFECVGEIEESVVALSLLSSIEEWKSAYIVKTLMPKVVEKYGDTQKLVRMVFTHSDQHNIPQEFQDERD